MSDSEGDNSPAISDSEEETVKNTSKKRKQSSKDGKSSKKAKKSSRVMDEDSDDDGGAPKSKFVEDEASESGSGDDDDDKVIDSSEEELDEDADTYEKDGFLVGDDEEDEEEEEQPRRRRKKKEKKETKKRSRLRHGRDDRDELDRDDLDLIQENLGKKPARVYSDDEDDDFDDDDGSPRKKKSAKGKQAVSKGLRDMFGSDSEDDDESGGGGRGKRRGNGPSDQYMDEQDYNSEDEFIVSDDDDGAGDPRRRRNKRPSSRRSTSTLPQGPSLDQLDEAEELFGDAEAFLEATRGGAAPSAASGDLASEKDKKALLLDKYEPSVLKEFHMTTSDSAVRERDIPERLQQLYKQRTDFPDAEERMEEAEWMVDAVLRKLDQRAQRDKHATPPTFHRSNIVTAIEHVLKFYHIDKLEPPYVQRYCKEYWKTAGLHGDELYLIQDLDLKWDKLDRKRRVLQKNIEAAVLANDTTESTTVRSCYQQVLRQTQDKGLADISQAFQMLEVNDKPNKQKKRPGRRTLYQLCLKGGLKDLASQFTVNSAILGGALIGLVPDSQVQVPTPQAVLAETCMPYLSADFPSVNDVLKGARHVAATQLASDPNVRARMREICQRHAVVFTEATAKGIEEIDEFHYCHGLQYIKEMPVAEMMDTDLYLKLLKGEQEGVLTIHFQIEHQHLIELLEAAYLDPKHASEEWQSQRRDIVREAVGSSLVPTLQEEIKADLLASAQEVVLARCSRKMKERLLVRPFEAKDLSEPHIMGVFVDATTDEPIAHIVALDENGDVIDKVQGRCKTPNCLAKLTVTLTTFLEDHPRLSAVVLNTSGGNKSMDVGELADVVRNKIRRHVLNDPEYLHVTFVKDDVARMFAKSKRAEVEFPEEMEGIRAAIGLARYLRNPLSELCAIWGFVPLEEPGRGKELLYLTVDPLQQMVNQEVLVRAYERVFIQVVNKVGIDVNVSANHSHASYGLQFVAGLGPVKAMALIEKVRLSGHIEKRQDLHRILSDKVVYRNCAGVLRIRERDALKDAALNPLDDTRIHPESYYMAVKICGDANNNTTMDLYDPDQYSYAVEDTMFQSATAIKAANEQYHPEPFKRLGDAEIADSLADLDLPAYAQRLEMQQKGLKLHTLESIKQELRYPYFDTRQKYKDPMLEDLFFLLNGESRDTLRVGMVVPCKLIKSAGENNVIVELHSGIRAQLKKEHLPTFLTCEGNKYLREHGFPRGMQVNAKIMDIVPDGDRYVLALACDDRSILTMTEECFNRRAIPSWTDVDRVIDDSKARYDKLVNKLPSPDKEKDWNKLTPVNGPVRKRRQIAHPVFKNVSLKGCMALMKDLLPGDVMLRPASKGSDHLSLTWKIDTSVYRHFDVHELDKPTEGRLGAKLVVKNETYDSIDELIARLIDPMNAYIEEIREHKNYMTGDVHAIGDELVKQKEANPTSVPWALHMYYKYPGCFSITYVARKSPRSFHFEVKPSGLRFFGELSCNEPIPSLTKAIAFFKKSASNPPKRREPAAAAKPTHSSYASGGTSSYGSAPPPTSQYGSGGTSSSSYSRDQHHHHSNAPSSQSSSYYDQNRPRNNYDQGRPRDDRRY